MLGGENRTHEKNECCWDVNVSIGEWTYIRHRIRNENIQGLVGETPIEDKIRKCRLRWFGQVRKRPLDAQCVNELELRLSYLIDRQHGPAETLIIYTRCYRTKTSNLNPCRLIYQQDQLYDHYFVNKLPSSKMWVSWSIWKHGK